MLHIYPNISILQKKFNMLKDVDVILCDLQGSPNMLNQT